MDGLVSNFLSTQKSKFSPKEGFMSGFVGNSFLLNKIHFYTLDSALNKCYLLRQI